jgi:CheY-like chemotaxis protein
MGHLLPYIATTEPGEFVSHNESTSASGSPPTPPPTPPATSINASSRSVLLVENDQSLLNLLRRYLKEMGYTVRSALNTEEALRLYRDFIQFNVVLIDYCISEHNEINARPFYCSSQTAGTELAKTILSIDPSQGIIVLAFDFQNVADVPRPLELIHLPVVVEISKLHLRNALEAIELVRAFRALSVADRLRLQKFAKLRVRGLGRAASGRDWQDLWQEAVWRTLLGASDKNKGRHWNKDKVDFVMHFAQAMRSIANSWKRQFSWEVVPLERCDSEGNQYSLLDNVASGDVRADDRLIEMEEEDRISAIFRGDADASRVLQGLMDGLKKNEILLRYGLDEKRYAAAIRRILRLLGRRGKDNEA